MNQDVRYYYKKINDNTFFIERMLFGELTLLTNSKGEFIEFNNEISASDFCNDMNYMIGG